MSNLVSYINDNYSLIDEYKQLFGRDISHSKFICPNPEHNHVNNTPSCKVYGNRFKCFGQCNRVFGVYHLWKWYAPQKIREVESSVVVPKVMEEYKAKLTKVKFSRDLPISEILKLFINDEQLV